MTLVGPGLKSKNQQKIDEFNKSKEFNMKGISVYRSQSSMQSKGDYSADMINLNIRSRVPSVGKNDATYASQQ